MSTLVFVDLKPNASDVKNMTDYLREVVPDTRSFEGCQDINIYLEDDGQGVVMVEHWDSKSHYEKYLAWRIETGVMDKLGAMLAEAPIIRFAENTGA
ncbi:MAG: antibiotic biosynthesis monooxygenase [Gammaproteobacteria bacterium]|nr:antibiotic biosynthesis monooxygenase [Gammaproteobacteria bacterium]